MKIKSIITSRWLRGSALVAVALTGSAVFYALGDIPAHQRYLTTSSAHLAASEARHDMAAGSRVAASRAKVAPQAFSEGMVAASPAVAEDTRRIQETQSFEYRADRAEIEALYERAIAACELGTCEVTSANLERHERILIARLSVRTDPDALPGYLDDISEASPSLALYKHDRSALDRTRQYEDIDARLRSQVALRDRLLSLLDSPSTRKTSDILEIERELARTQGQIESLQSQIRSIEEVTDRMTVHLSFRNDEILAAPTEPPYLANAMREWKGIFERSAAGVVRASASVTPLLIVGLVLYGVVGVIRRLRRRKARTRAT